MDADSINLGGWVRVASPKLVLTGGRQGVDTLARSTLMRVNGMNGNGYRVELPDRRVGFVVGRSVEPARNPVRQAQSAGDENLLERPVPGAVVIESLRPGSSIGVLGEFGQYQLVRTTSGEVGWLRR